MATLAVLEVRTSSVSSHDDELATLRRYGSQMFPQGQYSHIRKRATVELLRSWRERALVDKNYAPQNSRDWVAASDRVEAYERALVSLGEQYSLPYPSKKRVRQASKVLNEAETQVDAQHAHHTFPPAGSNGVA